jgi:hypothetical protein
MGYHVVTVSLRDGRKVEDVAIVDAQHIAEVRGCDGIPFEPEEVAALEVTHKRWQFAQR